MLTLHLLRVDPSSIRGDLPRRLISNDDKQADKPVVRNAETLADFRDHSRPLHDACAAKLTAPNPLRRHVTRLVLGKSHRIYGVNCEGGLCGAHRLAPPSTRLAGRTSEPPGRASGTGLRGPCDRKRAESRLRPARRADGTRLQRLQVCDPARERCRAYAAARDDPRKNVSVGPAEKRRMG